MRMISPEHLCGITVTYDGHTCSLASGETEILLSPETAAGLTGFFDLLARPADGDSGAVPSKSADGTQTILRFDTGSVLLGEDGNPAEVTYSGRTIRIEKFMIQ